MVVSRKTNKLSDGWQTPRITPRVSREHSSLLPSRSHPSFALHQSLHCW
jgi:hypothetical protein